MDALIVGEPASEHARPSGMGLDSEDAASRGGKRRSDRSMTGTEIDGQVIRCELRKGDKSRGLCEITQEVLARFAAAWDGRRGVAPIGRRTLVTWMLRHDVSPQSRREHTRESARGRDRGAGTGRGCRKRRQRGRRVD